MFSAEAQFLFLLHSCFWLFGAVGLYAEIPIFVESFCAREETQVQPSPLDFIYGITQTSHKVCLSNGRIMCSMEYHFCGKEMNPS